MEHEFLESLPLADLNVSLNPFESFICQLEEHPLSQCERSWKLMVEFVESLPFMC